MTELRRFVAKSPVSPLTFPAWSAQRARDLQRHQARLDERPAGRLNGGDGFEPDQRHARSRS